MKTLRALPLVPVIAWLGLSACDDAGPVDPLVEQLSVVDEIALRTIEDSSALNVALDLAQVSESVARRNGFRWGAHMAGAGEIQAMFQAARGEYRNGSQAGALDRLQEGRRMVARAIQASAGPAAIQSMVERLEHQASLIAEEPDEYVDPASLQAEMVALGQAARHAWGKGDGVGAGQLAVLGEQRLRQRHREDHADRSVRAELAVRLGASAIALATRILEETGATEEQLRFLQGAAEYQAHAVASLEAGNHRRAVHFARWAEWWALKAVVVPGGITDEELRYMVDLADGLLADARAAVGADPTSPRQALLTKAARLIEAGTTRIQDGNVRGLGPLWLGSVICFFLLG